LAPRICTTLFICVFLFFDFFHISVAILTSGSENICIHIMLYAVEFVNYY